MKMSKLGFEFQYGFNGLVPFFILDNHIKRESCIDEFIVPFLAIFHSILCIMLLLFGTPCFHRFVIFVIGSTGTKIGSRLLQDEAQYITMGTLHQQWILAILLGIHLEFAQGSMPFVIFRKIKCHTEIFERGQMMRVQAAADGISLFQFMQPRGQLLVRLGIFLRGRRRCLHLFHRGRQPTILLHKRLEPAQHIVEFVGIIGIAQLGLVHLQGLLAQGRLGRRLALPRFAQQIVQPAQFFGEARFRLLAIEAGPVVPRLGGFLGRVRSLHGGGGVGGRVDEEAFLVVVGEVGVVQPFLLAVIVFVDVHFDSVIAHIWEGHIV
mmetsp:Transcript_302/g.582  ORF Transcript_302/g.582 Transcript_302/m.582 type:complete len:322 (-) Transcript_302:445-1410(-)